MILRARTYAPGTGASREHASPRCEPGAKPKSGQFSPLIPLAGFDTVSHDRPTFVAHDGENHADDRKLDGKRSANEKLVTRFGEHDKLVGLEGAYRKLEVTLRSPMMKRTYLRFFDRLQRDLNVVSVVGRVTNLDLGKLEQIEEALSGRMKSIREDIEKETARAQTLIKKQGLDLSKLEFLEPMTVAAKVTSPISRLFLDLLPGSTA